jgi:hypothetical protein
MFWILETFSQHFTYSNVHDFDSRNQMGSNVSVVCSKVALYQLQSYAALMV